MKEKTKIIISVIITFIITISITVTASIVMDATDISFTSDKTNATNVKDSLDELYTKAASVGKCPEGKICVEAKISNVPIGSYISMTPTSTSYTPPSSVTGYAGTQNTINPSELNLWRVIRKNDDGTVDVVSEYVSSEYVYFYGKEGYINFVGGLNTIAAQYTNEKYVQKTRHMGYSNQTERLTDTSALSQPPPWTSSTTDNSNEAKGGGDIGYETDYNLVKTALGTVAGKKTSGKDVCYWLASRYFLFYSSSWQFFRGRYVRPEGLNNFNLYFYNNGFSGSSIAWAVRPILTLKSTVEIESGEGTSESPYKLE